MGLAQGDRFVREFLGGLAVLCCLWLRDRGFRSWSGGRGGGRVGERCKRWRRGLEVRVGLGGSEVCGVVVLVSWTCLIWRL